MMARPPDASLEPPEQMPPARSVPLDDAALLALAAEMNPELAALANLVSGRENALELARLQYIPDFNPFVGFTGTVSQMIGVGISIPTFLPEVRGRVREARADLRGMMAMYRQAGFDTAAQVVAALYGVRNSERQAQLFEDQIVPAAERVLDLSTQAYAAGTGSFLDLVESQRMLLDARLGLAEARAAREELLADLEELLGMDMEEIAAAKNGPGTRPAASTATAAPRRTDRRPREKRKAGRDHAYRDEAEARRQQRAG